MDERWKTWEERAADKVEPEVTARRADDAMTVDEASKEMAAIASTTAKWMRSSGFKKLLRDKFTTFDSEHVSRESMAAVLVKSILHSVSEKTPLDRVVPKALGSMEFEMPVYSPDRDQVKRVKYYPLVDLWLND